MSQIELVHSQLPEPIQRRVLRVRIDARILGEQLTRAQARSAYRELETARDELSKILDRADGKNA